MKKIKLCIIAVTALLFAFSGSLCSQSTVGQSYEGGIIAYILQPGDPGYVSGKINGLIAAPSDLSTGAEWGCVGVAISGADGTAIGTGNQNTMDIVAGCSTAGIAARLCSDLVLGGYSDWYLPSRDELSKLYLNQVAIGGFSDIQAYWSSSEFDSYLVWVMNFQTGYLEPGDSKQNPGSVRAVRSFSADPGLPTLTTTKASSITPTLGTCGGNISTDGGAPVIRRGVCWGTVTNPTITNDTTLNGIGTGSYISTLWGLAPGTKYYVRAYATNSFGTAYGNEISFTTYKSDAITDINGNYYNIVKIGSQVWMAENLKTTKLNNGTYIPQVPDSTQWNTLATPGYCWFNNDSTIYKDTYGALYNWYTVNTGKLCPEFWHVPTDDEFTILTNYAGGESVAGGKLKEIGITHWADPNLGAADEYGFTALPGGARLLNGGFYSIGVLGSWWSSIDTLSTYAWHRFVHNNDIRFSRIYDSKTYGFSVRCLKDIKMYSSTVVTNTSDSGIGSFRYALQYADSTIGVKDTITFNIPGTGPFTIQPLSPLPAITDPVVIDGYSQPGVSSTTSILLIELDGTKAGAGSNGLTINSNNCTIKGLVIYQFSGNGIRITNGTGNLISSNSIQSNGGLGIDLGGNGVTPNDTGDPDNGPNNLQNFPVLESVSLSTGTITISGSLNSGASKTYILQFFASKLADSTGYGEGQTYLGSKTLTTGTNGNAVFTATFSIKSSSGTVITATATDPLGNTSEFSKSVGGLQDQVVATSNWPLRFTMNQDGVPNISDGSDLNAVRASFQTWAAISTADISFIDGGTTLAKYANANDGVNLVSFEDDQFPFSYGVLAVAAKTLKIDKATQVAQIIDADIVVNPDFVNDIKYNLGVGYNNKNAGYFDIQSVITHEIGHILGLLHSGVVNSTMFFTLGSGITVRTLEQDDKSWASYRYPKQPGYNSTYGSISGNIKYGYNGQPPVAGALVYAINTSTNDSVHAYSDAKGDFFVPGLIPGSYYIYVEPLDGDVNGYNLGPGNISSYIYCNTVYTDYPGEFYSGGSESSEEKNDLKSSVSVSAGSTTPGINLITNKDITPPFVVKVRSTDLSGNLINILSNFSIKFSEPVDETSLSIGTCYLSAGSKTFGGTYTTLGDSINIIMFDPDSVLQYNTEYALRITGGVKDLKGNSLTPVFTKSFTTIPKDNVPPLINEVIPANGTYSVFVTSKIRVFFSEPMNKTSVEKGFTLSWTDANVSKTVAGSFSWDNDNVSITYTPSGSLREGTVYTLKLANSITDLSGNQLAGSETRSFTTVLQAAPTILYIGPGNNNTGVPLSTPVVVDFSEPINSFTVNSGTFKLLLGDNPPSGAIPVPGTFEFLNENARVIFRPGAELPFNQTYTIKLTNGIQDVSLTSMKFAGLTTKFTTATKVNLPHISYLDPPSGVIGAVVTISGSGFDPNPVMNTITFNGIKAPVKEATLSSLTTEVPLGALSGPVAVSVNGTLSDNTMHFNIIPQSLAPCDDIIASKSTGSTSSHDVDIVDAVSVAGVLTTYAYVTNPDQGTVTVVNLTTLETIAPITVGKTPMKIDINPQGTRAYVTNFNSHNVSVIDLMKNSTSYNKVIKTIPVGIQPYGIAVTPDGKRVYVANYYSENLSIIDEDPSSGGFDHVVANVSTGSKTSNVAVTPDAGMVLVTGDFGLKIINSNPADKDYNSVIANVSTGTKTKDVAVTPDAGLAIVSTDEGHLLVINLHPENGDYSEAVIANVSTGTKVSNVKVSGDGLFVYVTDTDNDKILVYQIGIGGSGTANGTSVSGLTLSPHNEIPVGNAPEGLVINANADRLYVLDAKTLTGNRDVTAIAICCGPISPTKAIGDIIITIQNMINNGTVKEAKGNELIKKLNEALINLEKGKTKTAVNNLGAINNQISALIKSGLLKSVQGNALITSINAIIAQVNGAKSALGETYLTDNELLNQDLISESKLGVIYPNPFAESITINYEIAESNENQNKVQIKVYDISGRLVSTLVDKMIQQGRYTTSWKGNYDRGGRAPHGTYFVLFRTGNMEQVREIMLIR